MPRKDILSSLISFTCVAIFFFFAFEYSLSTFLFRHILPYDQKRLLELFLLFSAPLLSFIFSSYSETLVGIFQSMRWPSTIFLGAFLFLGLLSCLFAEIPGAALLEWSLYVLLIFFCVFWCTVGLHIGKSFFFYNALLVFFAAAVYAFPIVKSYLYSIHHNLPINFFPFFINPRFFSQFALWTLPLLPLVDHWIKWIPPSSRRMGATGRSLLRVLFFTLASFWWGLALINGSRGLLLSFLLASLLGFIIFRKALIPWIFRQFLYILTAIFLIFLFISMLPSATQNKAHENNPSLSQTVNNINSNIAHLNTLNAATLNPRIFLYKSAMNLTWTHPFLGVGPMHFALGPTQAMRDARIFNGHPHNFPLLILSEWGAPAAISLGLFIFILLRNFSKNLPKSHADLIAPCFYISLVAGLMYSLVSGVTVMPLSQIMGAIIVANCLVIYFQNKPIFIEAKKTPYPVVIGALLLFSLLIVSINVIPNLRDLPRAESLWFQEHQGDIGEFIPRFWLQGWLTDGTKTPLK